MSNKYAVARTEAAPADDATANFPAVVAAACCVRERAGDPLPRAAMRDEAERAHAPWTRPLVMQGGLLPLSRGVALASLVTWPYA